MKFRVQAIDAGGRVVRATLRAESEDEARAMLLAEEIFPKRVEPAAEDEPVTWTSKTWVKDKMERARGSASSAESIRIPAGASTSATTLVEGAARTRGRFAAVAGTLYFEPEGRAADTRSWSADRIETALIQGFPARRLVVCLVDGGLLEFDAGFLFAAPPFKTAVAKGK